MKFSRIPDTNPANAFGTIGRVVHQVSATHFAGNLILEADYDYGCTRSGSWVRFRLRVQDSKSAPARLSASGRRTVSANWEAHRLVMQALFECWGEAKLHTALADYEGRKGFEAKHPATYHHQAGSRMAPVSFGSL